MARLFVGNFCFEHELNTESGWQPSASLRRISAERVVSWISLAEEGDMIWTPEAIPDEFWDSLAKHDFPRVRGIVALNSVASSVEDVVPWGWSAWTRAIAGNIALPSKSSVTRGNSREWSFALEQELGVALVGAMRLGQVEDFADAVRRSASEFGEPAADHVWVVKANFGMAARERVLGRGLTLTAAQHNWLRRRLNADGAVFFEPWLRCRSEVGIQWTLPPLGQGEPTLEGITPLLCDSQGGYRGSAFAREASIPREWQRAVEVGEQAAKQLQAVGYWGPLGIDAAVYEDAAGIAHVRPLQDINARHTMGRLALGFRRMLRPGEHGLWQHGRSAEWISSTTFEAAREIDLTPSRVGDHPPTHGSRLLLGWQ